MTRSRVSLKTKTESLQFDRRTGRLISFRSHHAPGQEFLASSEEHPVFVLQYLDRQGEYRRLTSFDARRTRVACSRQDGRDVVTMVFDRPAGLDMTVTVTARGSATEPGTRWNLSLRNDAGLNVVDVQFPFVVVRYELKGSILWPHYAGRLIKNPAPETLGPDSTLAWQFAPENGSSFHYPGFVFAQFMAYLNDRAGLYLACEDAKANIKIIKPLHRAPGIRLGIAHVGDWPVRGTRTLEYDVVLRGFKGDWHDAADLYRAWTLQQSWATPLHRRSDVPEWLLDAPAYITVRPQGELDIGPVFPVKEFLPYEKVLPLLDRLARRLKAPLVAVLMSWERAGPWIYPDCFPPIGGEASLKRFAARVRQRGWRVGSFCNGTRWVIGNYWNDYDGRDYFRKHNGVRGVSRTPGGAIWQEGWDRSWRPSYVSCLGTQATRRLAEDFVARIIGWGMESIQFFDQNMGASTFPCFAKNHGHSPVPGKWMAAGMRAVVEGFHEAARKAGESEVIHSTEAPCNETCLPLFQECDVRVIPPGHTSNYEFMPLYHYLYHECIILQGGMGMGPEPHHLETRNACNGVLGELPGAVMVGDGTLLNKDTGNWAPWLPKVGSNDAAVEMMRTVLALRRGPGRDYLTLGRMLRPAVVDGPDPIVWESNGRMNRIPPVFDAAWQAPNGRTGVVLANWTDKPRKVAVADNRLGTGFTEHSAGSRLVARQRTCRGTGSRVDVTVPALGCVLIEASDQP